LAEAVKPGRTAPFEAASATMREWLVPLTVVKSPTA